MAKATDARPSGPRPSGPRAPDARARRAAEELAAYLFIAPWLVGFAIFTFGAMSFSLGLSFAKTDLLSEARFVGWDNYARLASDPLFRRALWVTTLYTLFTVPLTTALALGIALLLNQRVRGLGVWRSLFYLPSIVSGAAVALLWGWVLEPEAGLLNQGLALLGVRGPRWLSSESWALVGLGLVALWGAGANMLLYLAGLQSIPTDLQDAARIDGAGPLRVFRHVTLPLLTPTILFNVVVNVIGSFQIFTTAYILTDGGPNNATLTLVLYLYRQAFVLFDFGYASAVAWALFALVLGFTLVLLRSSSAWVHYEGAPRR